jgi:IrrE N-terminal-like domain
VAVADLALEISRSRFPDSPIIAVEGGSLGDFEGALYPVPDRKGWAIIYNKDVSPGRRNFTVAHEFAHYLMHRPLFPEGIQCSEESVTFRDGPELEAEADRFAAYLLMPFDDFRNQLAKDAVPSLDDLSAAAKRYGVSLIACILRWLEYTSRRSMLVVARDGFVLWAKPSNPAYKSGLFIRTRKASPYEIPANSLIRQPDVIEIGRAAVDHPADVWFNEPCTEITLHSDKYDQSLALLHFPKSAPRFSVDEAPEEDTFDRFSQKLRGRFDD